MREAELVLFVKKKFFSWNRSFVKKRLSKYTGLSNPGLKRSKFWYKFYRLKLILCHFVWYLQLQARGQRLIRRPQNAWRIFRIFQWIRARSRMLQIPKKKVGVESHCNLLNQTKPDKILILFDTTVLFASQWRFNDRNRCSRSKVMLFLFHTGLCRKKSPNIGFNGSTVASLSSGHMHEVEDSIKNGWMFQLKIKKGISKFIF